jgi:hypothetical protein
VNLSLMRLITSTLYILLLALIFPLFAQDGGSAPTFSQAPYQIGEKLTYNVSFASFPSAAHVQVHIVARGIFFGRDAIQLRAHVETMDTVNVALYAINKDFTTYIDPASGLPFRAQEVTRDATRSTDAEQDLNQAAGTGAIPSRQRAFPGTFDFLSVFYRARALPLAQGASYSFQVRGESTEYQAELKVVGLETVKTNVGSFNTIVTKVNISGGSPIKNLRIYFSDDERHVPVLATAKVSTGDLRAELAGSELVKPAAPSGSPAPITPRPAPTPVPTPQVSSRLEWPFEIGEQLNYQVFLGPNSTPAGQATFQVNGRSRYFDRDGLLLSVKAQTTGAIARLFIANDQMESYVDPKGLLPYRSVFKLAEGQRRLNQTLVVNQETGSATTDKGRKIDIPVGTHDYLSLFYAVRTLNLTPSKLNAISILVEGKPKTMFINSLKRESIQLGDKKVPAILVSLTTDDPQSDKYQLRIWVSDDKRRLPLRITCATQLGPVRADLAILHASTQ